MKKIKIGIFTIVVLVFFAILFIKISKPFLLVLNSPYNEDVVIINPDEIDNFTFIEGICAPENVFPDHNTQNLYVSGKNGMLFLLTGVNYKDLKVIDSLQIAVGLCFGIDYGFDGNLYVSASDYNHNNGWPEKGSAVYQVDKALTSKRKLTDEIPGMKGIAYDNFGNLYLTSGNMDYMNPEGKILRSNLNIDKTLSKPIVFISKMKGTDGVFYNKNTQNVFFSTFTGIFEYNINKSKIKQIVFKNKTFERFGDFCIDKKGRYWMADPGNSLVKVFFPESERLVRIKIESFGQSSSCRIRHENNQDIIYIAENRREFSNTTPKNGRGVIVFPVSSVEKFFNDL